MPARRLNLCRRCATSLSLDSQAHLFVRLPTTLPIRRSTAVRSFFSKRSLYLNPKLLQIPPPDPSAPPPPPTAPTIQRDPGLLLGNNGIPVPPSPSQSKKKPRESEEERSWAETVLRTLSGGMKSDYLKCFVHSI